MFPQLIPSVYRFVVIRLKSNFIEVELIKHLSMKKCLVYQLRIVVLKKEVQVIAYQVTAVDYNLLY